ncbi:MAG: fumarate hydratase C-terminal domain-containing protein [Clostridia bacterium]|nr:fumarate hydratase C-terminal domain-containing protein [Clostridia bacterium]
MAEHRIKVEELREKIPLLHAGDRVLLSGVVYTARDAAHKRIVSRMDANEPLPFELCGACIYYAGPTPAEPGAVIGSCGPTTSGRMDRFAPRLLDAGLAAMIGKGERSADVVEAIVRNGAVYLCAVGGAGALAAQSVKSCREIAFHDLGCESIKRLEVEDFPLIVAIDAQGNDLFK